MNDAESPNIAVAIMRNIFHVSDVHSCIERLQSENEPLRSTYARMLLLGPKRLQVRPARTPQMMHLYEELPNFTEVLDDVKRQLALCQDSQDGLEIAPMLLLGPPGIGKTHFARELADLFGTGMGFVSMSSLTAGWILSGASSQWKGGRPGKVFETLVHGDYANPVMVVDEIDKAGGETAYDPLGSLYSLLERDTAQNFVDEFADVPIDASQIIWVATANEARYIPKPILDRVHVFEIEAPDASAARSVARRLYVQIRTTHKWGEGFDPEPSDDVLDCVSLLSPRTMRGAWMTAFGNAKLDNRSRLMPKDLPSTKGKRSTMGFVAQ